MLYQILMVSRYVRAQEPLLPLYLTTITSVNVYLDANRMPCAQILFVCSLDCWPRRWVRLVARADVSAPWWLHVTAGRKRWFRSRRCWSDVWSIVL